MCNSTLQNKDLDQIRRNLKLLKYTNWNKLSIIKHRLSKTSKQKYEDDVPQKTSNLTFSNSHSHLEKRPFSKSLLKEKISTKKATKDESNWFQIDHSSFRKANISLSPNSLFCDDSPSKNKSNCSLDIALSVYDKESNISV